MNAFLVLLSCAVLSVLARPDVLPPGHAGHVSVTQSSSGTYKYTIHLKDSIRTEERLADGTIRGQYTIIDANGLPQTFKYTAGVDGFRIVEGPVPVAPQVPVVPLEPQQVPALQPYQHFV